MRHAQVFSFRSNTTLEKLLFMSSLVPSRQCVFSPDLAATIGLEEAILLQCLSDNTELIAAQTHSGFDWFELTEKTVLRILPFWSGKHIANIAENLRQQGVILVASPPMQECGYIRFAFNEAASATQRNTAPAQNSDTATFQRAQAQPIQAAWSPDETCMKLLAQQGVPAPFARDQVPEFVQYWSERGEARHAWGNRFVTQVLRRWRDYEVQQHKADQQRKADAGDVPDWAVSTARANEPRPICKNWRPSSDALDILEIQAAVHRNFVEDAIPEFVLYWLEKGDHCNTWNARFITHVKRQWAGFQHISKNDLDPRPIEANWQPSPDVFDVLKFARIDLAFAERLLPEFVIYWRDRNEARPSWNTLFLQFVKQQWQRQPTGASTVPVETNKKNTRERSIVEDLTDRSWAT